MFRIRQTFGKNRGIFLANRRLHTDLHPSTVPAAIVPTRRNRPRHITPQAGHALELLGHAIEYLTDEYVHEGGDLSSSDASVQAIQILMRFNREIYFACPVAPTFTERCCALLRLRS